MVNLQSVAGFLSGPSRKRSETWVERLYHFWTPIILLSCLAFLLLFRTWGAPIDCYFSMRTPAMEQYGKSKCLVNEHYKLVNTSTTYAEKTPIKHYTTWVPIVLLLMIPCFKVPYWFWRLFCCSSQIDVDKLVSFTDDVKSGCAKDLEGYGSAVEDGCPSDSRHRHNNRRGTCLGGCLLTAYPRLSNNALLWFYIASKILSLCNIGIQMAILNSFYPSDYPAMSLDVLRKFVMKLHTPENEHFPLDIICDFELHRVQNVITHVFQCVLPINVYNKAILSLLSMWLILLLVIISIDTTLWIVRAILHHNKCFHKRSPERMTRNYAQLAYDLGQFQNEYSSHDATFVLGLLSDRLAGKTVGDIMTEMTKKDEDSATYQDLVTKDGERDPMTKSAVAYENA